MGTNYYLKQNCCDKCGREEIRTHIGKSSGGWCFSLHVVPEEGINNLEDWKALFSKPGNVIVNEYGDKLTEAEMLDTILNRSHPAGLNRHDIGEYCIGHGAGTYDLIPGYFS